MGLEVSSLASPAVGLPTLASTFHSANLAVCAFVALIDNALCRICRHVVVTACTRASFKRIPFRFLVEDRFTQTTACSAGQGIGRAKGGCLAVCAGYCSNINVGVCLVLSAPATTHARTHPPIQPPIRPPPICAIVSNVNSQNVKIQAVSSVQVRPPRILLYATAVTNRMHVINLQACQQRLFTSAYPAY